MVYVNTGWSGPSPVSVADAIKQRLDYEMEQSPTSPEVYQSGVEIRTKARAAVAWLLNATPEEICLTKNTTEGLNIIINGLPWSRGDEIITFSLEHSSVLVPSYFQQRRHGVVVKVLPLATHEGWEAILSKVEAALTQHTRLVFLSHIQYSCGLRMPVKEIRQMLKDRGIMLLLDGAQTAGHIPLDVKDMDCDFYSIPGQKWLLGPEGVGALYIRKELITEVEPMQVAARAVLSPNDFHQFQPNTSSIDKFLLTSTSTPLQVGMLEAIRFIQEVGVGEIEQRNLDLATSMKQALQETAGVKVLSPLERQSSSGLVSFTIEGVDPKDAVAYLWAQHRIVTRSVSSPSCVRVSWHFFNTEEEVHRVVEAVRNLTLYWR
jgi:selenocysteine lyase/cysteine desulfurase